VASWHCLLKQLIFMVYEGLLVDNACFLMGKTEPAARGAISEVQWRWVSGLALPQLTRQHFLGIRIGHFLMLLLGELSIFSCLYRKY
jgi:hypothetical protein